MMDIPEDRANYEVSWRAAFRSARMTRGECVSHVLSWNAGLAARPRSARTQLTDLTLIVFRSVKPSCAVAIMVRTNVRNFVKSTVGALEM